MLIRDIKILGDKKKKRDDCFVLHELKYLFSFLS